MEFRANAADHAGNVEPLGGPQASTQVDREAPRVTVNPLPAVTVATHFVLTWSATDNLSGVAHYDVQFRENHVAPFNPNLLKPNAPITTSFTVHWAEFAQPEAPIATVELHYQINGGAWQLWQSFPANQLSATFPYQQLGHGDALYGFEAIAITTTGQHEPASNQAEATMLVDLADAVHPRAFFPYISHGIPAVNAAGETTQ